MQAVFPGRPQAALQAFGVARWNDAHLIAYICKHALVILRGPRDLLQTISHADENDELQAVAVHPTSLKIAVCDHTTLYIYQPIDLEDGTIRWLLQARLLPASNDCSLARLAWGGKDEILSAGGSLTLFQPHSEKELWSQQLANPAKIAAFAHDASLIATTGRYDRLVKIWRRLYTGGDTESFDSTYAPHPAAVTDMRWRGRPDSEEHVEYVLYTSCVDGKLRVWTATDHHGLQTLQMWVELDLFVAIPPAVDARRSVPERRFFVTIDSWTLESLLNDSATTDLDGETSGQEEKDTSQHQYKELLDRKPELCLVLDDQGNMSAWGLERVGCKARQETDIFNISQSTNQDLGFRQISDPLESFTIIEAFASRDGSRNLNFLVQHFDGRIQWYISPVDHFLGSSDRSNIDLLGVWTGHATPIDKFEVLDQGRGLRSKTVQENISWRFQDDNLRKPLELAALDAALTNGIHAPGPQSDALEERLSQLNLEDAISDGSKAAILNATRTEMTIWDLKTECVEHRMNFERHEEVTCLRWTTTNSQNVSILAIALQHRVLVVAEAPYDQLRQTESWLTLVYFDISSLTNIPLADVAWLGQGDLMLAAGLQMFHFRPVVESRILIDAGLNLIPTQDTALCQAVESLHQSLAIYDPTLLTQFIAAGQFELVEEILMRLDTKFKFYTDGDDFDSQLSFNATLLFKSDIGPRQADNFSPFGHDEAMTLIRRLQGQKAPYLTDSKQESLLLFIQAFASLYKQRLSVDSQGLRYLFGIHHRSLHDGEHIAANEWQGFCWAAQCSSQDILVDVILQRHQGRILWKDARDYGMFMWLSDTEALRNHFETIARNEYSKTDERNPVDCTLHYLALRKKQVLVGLWRMAGWNREQTATLKLLAHDFSDPRWRTTALKNAYALLGKRRLEYAASFFLLADQLKDACSILANQIGDLQLAVAVARVYEGDNGPVLKELLQELVLPKAVKEGDRWLASCAYLLLRRSDLAAQAAYAPLEQLPLHTQKGELSSHSWLKQDPSLAHWYAHLRDNPDPADREYRILTSSKEESKLVLRSAHLYSRMGCDLLSLHLLQKWAFLRTPEHGLSSNQPTTGDGTELNAGHVADEESSDTETAGPDKTLLVDGKLRIKVEAEPSTTSILDSFDF